MAVKAKAAAYHGIQNVAFAVKEADGYSKEILDLKYAQSLNPGALLEAVEQYADDRLLFRIPSDTGYEAEYGTTAPDPALEAAAGYSLNGAQGTLEANAVMYVRGAFYYEFTERDENGKPSQAKAWMYNVEVGKGARNHATNKNALEFGTYSYPVRVYGDQLMDSTGEKVYVDENGMTRTVFIYVSRPGDTGYSTFRDAVPTPKLAAAESGEAQ